MAGYFPYDVGGLTPGDHGLVSDLVKTSLGSVHVVRPQARDATALFLHGLSMDWTTWTPLLRAAAAAGEPRPPWLLVDLPGFGRSAPLPGPVTLDQIGTALTEALDELGLAQVDVVGHSMGGFAGLHLASTRPDRVRSVASLNGAYATVVDIVNRPVASLLTHPRAWFLYQGMSTVAGGSRPVQDIIGLAARTGVMRLGLAGLVAHPSRVPPSLLVALAAGARPDSARLAEATGDGYDYRDRWAAIRVPVLAGFGAHDRLVTARDERVLHEALPSARSVRFPDSAHLSPLERPGPRSPP